MRYLVLFLLVWSPLLAETAWLFAQAFGTTPQFWVNLQANYDLASARPTRSVSKLRKAG